MTAATRRAPGGRAGIGGHHRAYEGRTECWITPPSIIEAVGLFDLDPCAHPEQPFATARTMIRPPADGLTRQWEGLVWLNPPYGPETARWMAKMARHGDGIALVFARTDTAWWHDWVAPHAAVLLFLRGRLNFYRPNGERSAYNAGGPSVLIAYGAAAATRLSNCTSIDGWIVQNAGGAA